ncbi:FAD-dependent thymidylate synthase [Candidatus Woesearchaeota archaeon]|nr:FAD-dependent thymidylate synthase [Candidatus Woesearchaeota archaeon]
MTDDLQVHLAGFNVDRDGLDEIRRLLEQDVFSEEDKQEALCILNNLTPETIAASYARISRDSRPIPELRKDSRDDVDAARKSYRIINFAMGHKSIAKHVDFNFDVMGLSRRSVEDVESKRLQSYTEKSQRFIKLKGDFVLPKEIEGTGFESRFLELVELQNRFYSGRLKEITSWHAEQDYTENFKSLGYEGKPDKQETTIDGYGKEDARYVLTQATQTQIGMTVSARNFESLVTKLRSSGVKELISLGDKLFAEVDGIAPSVVKYVDPTDYFMKTRPELQAFVEDEVASIQMDPAVSSYVFPGLTRLSADDVSLYAGLLRDHSIVAGMLFSSSSMPYSEALARVAIMDDEDRIAVLDQADKYQEKHDPKLREYELGDRVAEFRMSASAFAQMKRHRMNTIIPQEYDVRLGVTVPASIRGSGLEDEFKAVIDESTKLYLDLVDAGLPLPVADMALTNAHRRRILFDANNRQVYAFGAERLNLPAQWDIRNLANQYVGLVQQESPVTLRNVVGKDRFYDAKKKE